MPRSAASPPPRERLQVDARRAQLLALGLAVFSERAYDEVSIEDFARTAGVSKGLLYHYFPTKRELYVAALGFAARQLLDATAPDESAPREEQLRRALEAYLDFVERHGRAYVALIRGGVGFDPAITAIVEETRAALTARILGGLPRGPTTPLRRATLRGWIGFVEAMVTDWITRRVARRDQLIELLSSVLFDAVARATEVALRPRPPAAPRRQDSGRGSSGPSRTSRK